MGIKYDIEDFLADIKKLLVEKLNDKIDVVSNLKSQTDSDNYGDTITLDQISEDAYFFQSWSEKILNQTPAIYYGLESTESQGLGAVTLSKYKIFIEVVLVDSGMDNFSHNRLFRYTRCLKELFEENWDKLPFTNQTKIETTSPISFRLNEDTSEELRAGGILITTALA